jgi:hypothetical protein
MRGTPEVKNGDSLVTVTLTVDEWTDIGTGLIMVVTRYKTLGWEEDFKRAMNTMNLIGTEIRPYVDENC